jgi:hypothetical protein
MALALTLGCGSAKSTKYQGPPLASVQGVMNGLSAATPISLAIAWYPFPNNLAPNQPLSFVSSDVTYQGSFPISYTFNLYDAPPSGAMADIVANGASYQEAMGVLVAYQDDNGNGELDAIETNGAPVDTILGTSVPDITHLFSSGFMLAYVNGSTNGGLSPGYHLLEAGQDVDLSTRVPIAVTQTPDLNLFVCQQLFEYPQVLAQAGTACAVAPPHAELTVGGQFYGGAGNGSCWFSVTDGIHVLPDAVVNVNGAPISLSSQDGAYANYSLNVPSGPNTFSITEQLGSVSGSVNVPQALSLVAPADNATLTASDGISASWAAVDDAQGYQVWVTQCDADGCNLPVYENTTTGTSIQIPALSVTGSAALLVDAVGSTYSSPDGSISVTGYTVGAVSVTLQ